MCILYIFVDSPCLHQPWTRLYMRCALLFQQHFRWRFDIIQSGTSSKKNIAFFCWQVTLVKFIPHTLQKIVETKVFWVHIMMALHINMSMDVFKLLELLDSCFEWSPSLIRPQYDACCFQFFSMFC